jgi:hypothetical protein
MQNLFSSGLAGMPSDMATWPGSPTYLGQKSHLGAYKAIWMAILMVEGGSVIRCGVIPVQRTHDARVHFRRVHRGHYFDR